MRVIATLTIVALVAGTLLAQAPLEAVPPKPAKVDVQGASYSLGYQMGARLRRNGAALDTAAYTKGMQEAMAGKQSALSEEQMNQLLVDFQRDAETRIGTKNKQEGDAFLANNAKQPGVKSTKSGLQYKVIKEGTGKVPTQTDVVKVHYRGTLIDGTEFDSSYGQKAPVTLPIQGIIPGWSEALQMMKVGSKWQLFVPAALAYGPDGAPPVIGPNATLIFDIDLLGIDGQ